MINKENFKKIKIAAAVLLILSVLGYYLLMNEVELGLAKSELILKVSTNSTAAGAPEVNNVTFEQSKVAFFYKRADNPPAFPEIDVNARINRLNSIPASFWSSVPYRGDDTYTVRVFFKDGSEPKKGDVLIMPIRITTHTGAVAYKTTAFYEWE